MADGSPSANAAPRCSRAVLCAAIAAFIWPFLMACYASTIPRGGPSYGATVAIVAGVLFSLAAVSWRRWSRFSMRGLLLAAVPLSLGLAWSSYALHWIRVRHECLELRMQYVTARAPGAKPIAYESPLIGTGVQAIAPGGLWIFGETGYGVLFFGGSAAEVRWLHELFPEARIRSSPYMRAVRKEPGVKLFRRSASGVEIVTRLSDG